MSRKFLRRFQKSGDLRALEAKLQQALAVESALMVQYLYAAYTAVPPENASAADETLANRWSLILSSLAIGEMFHLAAVANMLVAAGFRPDFSGADFRHVRARNAGRWVEGGAAFALTPFSQRTLKRLLAYELEDSPAPERGASVRLPWYYLFKLRRQLAGWVSKPLPSIGELYRQIDAFLTRWPDALKADHKDLLQESDVEAVSLTQNVVRDATSRLSGILKLTPDPSGSWREVVWSLIVQGEGGAEFTFEGEREFSHVELLATVIAEMAANRTLAKSIMARNVASNPTLYRRYPGPRSPSIEDPAQRALAFACAWTYVLILQLLAAIWGKWPEVTPRASKKTLFSITRSVMMALLGPLTATLLRTPDQSIPPRFIGPTFEIPDGADVTAASDWNTMCEKLIKTTDKISDNLNTVPPLPNPRAANALETIASLRRTFTALKNP